MSTHTAGYRDASSVASEPRASPKSYIRPKEAAKKLGIGLSTLWMKIKNDPEFPQPIKLGPNTTVLADDEIDRYVETRARHSG